MSTAGVHRRNPEKAQNMLKDPSAPIPCAHCGSGYDYLHQFVVVVHNRASEDGPSKPTIVSHRGLEPEAFSVPENPSTRRQGVSIGLCCEHCRRASWLHVWQHKGQTFTEVTK